MCTLRIFGANFEAESYLAGDIRLEPTAVFWPGVPAYERRVARGRSTQRGFHVGVSRRDWSNWDGQIDDATAFLEKHHAVLGELSQRDDVEVMTLDFPADGRDHFILCDRTFPVRLLRAAAAAGVALELTVYAAAAEEYRARERNTTDKEG